MDIDGAVDMASTLAVGGLLTANSELQVNGTGTVAVFEATDGAAYIQIKDDDGTSGFIGVDAGSVVFQTPGSSFANKFVIASDGSLSTPTAGTSNVRFGVNAGNSIASGGNYNTVVGDEAGTAITTGDYSTGVGYTALRQNTTGANNTASGGVSMYSNTTGSDNTAYGYDSLSGNTTASNNTAVGKAALKANTTASYNYSSWFKCIILKHNWRREYFIWLCLNVQQHYWQLQHCLWA